MINRLINCEFPQPSYLYVNFTYTHTSSQQTVLNKCSKYEAQRHRWFWTSTNHCTQQI